MKILRKVNVVMAILILSLCIYQLFIGNMGLPENFYPSFIGLMFFLLGIEKVIDKDMDRKTGYVYIVIGLILFMGIVLKML